MNIIKSIAQEISTSSEEITASSEEMSNLSKDVASASITLNSMTNQMMVEVSLRIKCLSYTHV